MSDVAEELDQRGLYHHPRSPQASVERLREVAGILSLTEPIPAWKLLREENDEERGTHD